MAEGSTVEEQFAADVRDVLRHIHDYRYLQRHRLAKVLFPQPTGTLSQVQQLRRAILQTLEELAPLNSEAQSLQTEWLRYRILTAHYVEERQLTEMCAELSLSERQLYREQSRGIAQLAQKLWAKYGGIIGKETVGRNGQAKRVTQESQQSVYSEAQRLRELGDSIDVEVVVRDVLDSVIRPLVDARAIRLTFSCVPGLPTVRASRTLVRQVLMNVLSRLAAVDDVYQLDVDIAPTQRATRIIITALHAGCKIGDDATLEWVTAQELVEVIGGRWHGAVEDDGRCSLSFDLGTEEKLILVVDDNTSAHNLLRRHVAGHGCRIVGASSGEQALGLAREIRPDVILLDIMLPTQDGWEILKCLQEDPETESVPVIVSSVLAEAQLASALGARGYLRKPFTQMELLSALALSGALA